MAGAPRRGLRRGGGKSAALPLTGWLAWLAGCWSGRRRERRERAARGLAFPGPPSAPRGWAMDARWGVRAAMAHVTETPGPRDRDPRAWEAGWGPPAADPRGTVGSRGGWARGMWPVLLGEDSRFVARRGMRDCGASEREGGGSPPVA